jgi:hypothetical protein
MGHRSIWWTKITVPLLFAGAMDADAHPNHIQPSQDVEYSALPAGGSEWKKWNVVPEKIAGRGQIAGGPTIPVTRDLSTEAGRIGDTEENSDREI